MEAILSIDMYGSIGANGDLLIRDSEDLQHFRRVTNGCQLFAGRKTAEGLPELPGRRVIPVSVSFERGFSYEESLGIAEMYPRNVVIGGGEIYEVFWDDITIFHITEFQVDLSKVADTFFNLPRLSEEFTLINNSYSDGCASLAKCADGESRYIPRTYDTYVRNV